MTSSVRINNKKGGFTLVELLIVIGIIGLLSTVLVVSFGRVRKVAMRNEAQKIVDQAKVSLEAVLLNTQSWPAVLQNYMAQGFTKEVCWYLQQKKMMDLTTKEILRVSSTGAAMQKEVWEWSKTSLDRFGLLDPWGRNALKINVNASDENAELGNGNTTKFKDHLLQYRLDLNGDGFIDSSDCRGCSMPVEGMRVRAKVIVWSRGEDGLDDGENASRYPKDDSLSWSLTELRAQ